MMKIVMALGALLVVGTTGCVGNLGSSDVDVFRGSLGSVDFDGAPEIREVRITRREVYVDLRLEDQEAPWAAMVGISIPRGPDAEDGTMTLRTEEAELIGCSGEEDGAWEFDCRPDDFFVDAYGGKDALRLEFEGTFTGDACRGIPEDAPDDSQTVDGNVDVDLI